MDLKVTQEEDGVTLYEGQETAQDYSNFSIIPAWIMRHPKLQANDKLVYSLIFSFNTNSKTFFASNAFIAASLNISVPTVQRILANLEKLGLVYRKLENGHRTSVTARLIDGGAPISQTMPPISSAIPPHITDDTPPYHLRYHTNKDTKKDTNKYIYTKKYFREHSDEILQEVKAEYSSNPLYEGKDFDKVMQEFLDGIEIKDYKYKNYRLAYLKWLRNSRHVKDVAPVSKKSSDFFKLTF